MKLTDSSKKMSDLLIDKYKDYIMGSLNGTPEKYTKESKYKGTANTYVE